MKRLILAAALALSAPAAVAHDGPGSTGSVQRVSDAAAPAVAVVDAFHAALGSGDPEAVMSLLTEDVMVLEEGGAERSRDEYAGHHLPADMTFAAATTAEVTRRAAWVEGDVAWVLTEGRTVGAFNGRPVARLTAETMILHRDGDVWRIRHIHWSSRAPA
ncbi:MULTISPECIES: YybH family protein [Brevundimonas]|uniref:YybH family protein n=1 Tax=Brevundimonas TaxID=41275 RepID=UPI000F012322|nr:nuclear transport factor 2 family protein [Brevundimonas lutea]